MIPPRPVNRFPCRSAKTIRITAVGGPCTISRDREHRRTGSSYPVVLIATTRRSRTARRWRSGPGRAAPQWGAADKASDAPPLLPAAQDAREHSTPGSTRRSQFLQILRTAFKQWKAPDNDGDQEHRNRQQADIGAEPKAGERRWN